LAEWEEGGEYDEQPPRYVRYTIEWKLKLNTKNVGSVTEKDLVVAPSDYWEEFLKADLENMLQTKRKRHQRVRSEGTAITVSVNDRTQTPLEKFCPSININWKPVEKQLRKWSNLLRIGKRLKVTIAFNYRQDDDGTQEETKGVVCRRPEECSLSVRHRSMRRKKELGGPQVGILYMS
jgi:hypothetical protein